MKELLEGLEEDMLNDKNIISLVALSELEKNNKTISLFNNGLNFRDFTYVDDVVKILYLSCKKNITKKTINICRSRPIKTIDLVLMLKKICKNKNLKINKTGFVKGEMIKTHGCNNKFKKRDSNSLSKLSLFQKNDTRYSKKCPLSVKNAPVIDYKNISLLKKYISDNGKIISSKITSVTYSKQKKLTREIKKAKILGLI